MKWDQVLTELQTALTGDATLTALIPADAIRLGGEEVPLLVPSLDLTVINDLEQEVDEPTRIQFDVFARDFSDLVSAVARIRELVTNDTPMTLGSLKGAFTYGGGRGVEGSRNGAYGHSFDVIFAPVRVPADRYHH